MNTTDPPKKIKDLTGKSFGRWIVQQFAGFKEFPSGNKKAIWECLCSCGTKSLVIGTNLTSRKSSSCGCISVEIVVERSTKHGLAKSRIYRIWGNMLRRCKNIKNPSYPYYGGRGIEVCPRWMDFNNFLTDMGFPSEGATIERKDNNGNYCPDNCAWANRKDQARNRRSSAKICFQGQTKTIQEWAEITGIQRQTISYRIKNGWSVEDALTRSPSNGK